MDQDDKMKDENRETSVKGWLIVSGLALFFLLYGLSIYFVVGDKGPPGWDFGVIPDIPGQSVYSTSPEPAGNAGEPDVQHVSETPSQFWDREGGRAE
jgi:hypothetical protein